MDYNYLNDLFKQHEKSILREILIKTVGIAEPQYRDYQSVFTMPVKGNPNAKALWYKNDIIGILNYSNEYDEKNYKYILNISFIPKIKP